MPCASSSSVVSAVNRKSVLRSSPPSMHATARLLHDVDELVMLIEGEIEIEFEGTALRPDVGEEVVIPANARHTGTER